MSEKPLHVQVAERIKARVTVDDSGCWVWQGHLDRKGYARMSLRNRPVIVSRAAYEVFVAPIPDGLTIDHLCRNPPCVNPSHLEPVTLAENRRRAAMAVTACPQGHAYDANNTFTDRRGRRACKTCKAARQRAESPATAAARMRAWRARHPATPANRAKKATYDKARYGSGVRRG